MSGPIQNYQRFRRGLHQLHPVRTALLFATVVAVVVGTQPVHAQQRGPLTVTEARRLARLASPAIAAAQASVDAAAALERQAGVRPNPTVSYNREQTSIGGQANSQDIAAIEQRLELGGQSSARVAAARLRKEAAQARLSSAEATLDLEIARAYATVAAAQKRAALMTTSAVQFHAAAAAMTRRLAEGDVSAYEAQRVKLEAARYEALKAESAMVLNDARLRLWSHLGQKTDTAFAPLSSVADSLVLLNLVSDSVLRIALQHNTDLQAATIDVRVAEAEADVTARDRRLAPALTAGLKRESAAGSSGSGFVMGISLPVPLWDRRTGALAAAQSEIRRLTAEREVVIRRITQETASSFEAVRRFDAQVSALRSVLGDESRAALWAAETAYAEGEITLVEWLDAVRAYQEAESAFASVLSQSFIQRALLERLLGMSLIR